MLEETLRETLKAAEAKVVLCCVRSLIGTADTLQGRGKAVTLEGN